MDADPTRVVIRDNEAEHRYELLVDDVLAVIVVYEVRSSTMTLSYTKVAEGFARRGFSSQLVAHVLGEARSRGLQVLPTCSFVATYIKNHSSDYLDLVPESRRGEFAP
ncbi:MAG: N-acetyltransferase [Acidimicrobiaceae bacterium]|nr:N-acetyltransferase [Acidimicrobiaceae bacterium]